ncbi:MAG: membrane protein insertion efficiency factor YidD [Actinobacteria bacterium]|nr:membrane protein insertion efficiency factor YidD [Actinomycetota bacterium]
MTRPIVIRLLAGYQRAMEGRPSPCRFTPSCSTYAIQAVETRGTFRGLLLTLHRLLRCRPFGPSGWDPVPPRRRQAVEHTHQDHSPEGKGFHQ